MRKVFVLIILLLSGFYPVFADYLPSYSEPSFRCGTGLIAVNGEIPVYETDNENGVLSALIKIGNQSVTIKERGVKNPLIETTFIAYIKENNLALLSVENDTDDWYYVCYDRKRKLFGWVKKSENIDFMDWESFLNLYGRKNGIYIFRNVSDEYKKLYSAPNEDSTVVDSFNFPKHIALWLVNNDWLLVKVTTYDGYTKTGWMRWRTNDKNILAFPDFRN